MYKSLSPDFYEAWNEYHQMKLKAGTGISKVLDGWTYFITVHAGFIYLDRNDMLLAGYNLMNKTYEYMNNRYPIDLDKKMIIAFKYYCANRSIKGV